MSKMKPATQHKPGPIETAFVFSQNSSGDMTVEVIRIQDEAVVDRSTLYDKDSASIIMAKFSRDMRYRALTGETN